MENTQSNKPGGKSFEVHAQTILGAVTVPLLVAGIFKLFYMSNDLIVIKEQALNNKDILLEHTKVIKEQERDINELYRNNQQYQYRLKSLEDWRDRLNEK
jgi:hypothetical protein